MARPDVPEGHKMRRLESRYFASAGAVSSQCNYSPGGFWTYETGNSVALDAEWQRALAQLVKIGALESTTYEQLDLIGSIPDEQLETVFSRPGAGLPEVTLLDFRQFGDGSGSVRAWGMSEDGSELVLAASATWANCGDAQMADKLTRAMQVPKDMLRCCGAPGFQSSHARRVMCAASGTECGHEVADTQAIARHRALHARLAEADTMVKKCPDCAPTVGSVWRRRTFLDDFEPEARRKLDARLPAGPVDLAGWKTVRAAYRAALARNDAAFRVQWLSTMGC